MARGRWWHQENMMTFCQQIMMLSSFFQFNDDFQQSRMRILDAWSLILTVEVTVPFYHTKCEDKAKRYRCLAYSYQTLHGGRVFFPFPHCKMNSSKVHLEIGSIFLGCFTHYFIFENIICLYLFSFVAFSSWAKGVIC